MVVNKRKKNSRQRGSWTHGWGEKKKHRGAGHRGGRGNAGTGKRGDAKKPSVWVGKIKSGKQGGFVKKGIKKVINTVNISYFEANSDKLVNEKKISLENGCYVIDANKLNINKILGCGKITKKIKVSCDIITKEAIEKIKAAGGEVISDKKEAAGESEEKTKKEE